MPPTTTSPTQIEALFLAQKAHAPKVKESSAQERRAKLKSLERALMDHRDELKEGMWKDFQKPGLEVDLTEIYPTLMEIRFTVRRLKRWMRHKRVPTPLTLFGASSKIIYEPKGVCLILSPWNFPIQLILAPLVSAIAAGNTAILKPSEHTPHTNAVLGRIIGQLFQPEEVAFIEGDVETATALLKLKFDHIFFTGAASIGKIIMKAAAENLSSVTLELGGKSPTIIDETVNLDRIIPRISWAKFVNGGQTCIAPDYILIHESKKEDFLNKMKIQIEKQYGQDPFDSEDYVKIINQRHTSRIKQYIDAAVAGGAKVVCGGKVEENDRLVSPSLLIDVPLQSSLMQEEIFGPVLPIIPYANKAEAANIIQSLEKPLAMYIYSKSAKNIRYFLEHTTAGGTSINISALHVGNGHMPFGGVNHSGIGKARGRYGFLEFSNQRGVMTQHIPSTVEWLIPPYNEFKQRLISFFMKNI